MNSIGPTGEFQLKKKGLTRTRFGNRCIMQMELELVLGYNADDVVREIKDVVEKLMKQDYDLTESRIIE